MVSPKSDLTSQFPTPPLLGTGVLAICNGSLTEVLDIGNGDDCISCSGCD
ncbi:hypothetical protein [Nostoc sp. C057]|nr:hypothetical protein [Nostoc sp. C057]